MWAGSKGSEHKIKYIQWREGEIRRVSEKKKKKSGNFLDVSSFSLSKVVEFWQKLKPRLDLTKSVIVSQSSETTLSA